MSWAIWITGRPGSGKTTLATRVAEALQTWPVTVKVLDLAATAPRRAWRDAAREWIEHFAEVQLVCPSEVCFEREQSARWRVGGARGSAAVEVAPDIALDYEESLHPELRLHTHAPDFRSTVEDVLLLARRLHRAAAAPVTPAGRNVP
jgi:adenylylsulfate kinase-like enzyme